MREMEASCIARWFWWLHLMRLQGKTMTGVLNKQKNVALFQFLAELPNLIALVVRQGDGSSALID